jgi:FKBP-type peptidyl-prolyl cis-trans isomerase
MSRKLIAAIGVIVVLIAIVIFWPEEKGETTAEGKSKYISWAGGGGYHDADDFEQARPARRARATGRAAPEKIRTESGLIYQVLQKGTGATPGPTDKVEVSYRGYLPDGTDFSSTPDGESGTFMVNDAIKGWVEGLQLMQVGSIYRFIIPSELAYGDRAVGNMIKANQTLIFEIELLAVEAESPQK